jgi:hypothetical protein
MKWTAILITSIWILQIVWLLYQLIKYIENNED